jgi:Bacterial RNA polymerase, alpha chain C terminal domain
MSKKDKKESYGINPKDEEFTIAQVVKNSAEAMRQRREEIAAEKFHIRHSLIALTNEFIKFEQEDDDLVNQINTIQMLLEPEKMTSVEILVETDWRTLEFNSPVEFARFSVRTYNCIKKAQINTIADLFRYEDDQYLEIKNLGKKSQQEISKFKKQFLETQKKSNP